MTHGSKLTTSSLLILVLTFLWLTGCDRSESEPGMPTSLASDLQVVLGSGQVALQRLPQNWTVAESNEFYNAPQGSRLLPYRWFLHLEQADTTQLFRIAENIRRFGYLPRRPGPGNPDGLPVGFVRDAGYENGAPALGLTCAACHTGLVTQRTYAGTKAFLVDGAPTLASLAQLLTDLTAALEATLNSAEKFERFFANVLPQGSPAQRAALRGSLQDHVQTRQTYNSLNLPASQETPFGHGRVDAFGAIMNQVVVDFLNLPGNHAAASAPVSYPFLWDAPQHDRVQWNGAAENKSNAIYRLIVGTSKVGALGRNTGEVLGVFGEVDPSNQRGLLGGYDSTDDRDSLIAIEESITKLWSPRWEDAFGALDVVAQDQGEQLFMQHCQGCHQNRNFDRTDPQRTVQAVFWDTGTDQTMAHNFATRIARSGVLEGRRASLRSFFWDTKLGRVEPVSKLLSHVVARAVVGTLSPPDSPPDLPPEALFVYDPRVHIETANLVMIGPVSALRKATVQSTVVPQGGVYSAPSLADQIVSLPTTAFKIYARGSSSGAPQPSLSGSTAGVAPGTSSQHRAAVLSDIQVAGQGRLTAQAMSERGLDTTVQLSSATSVVRYAYKARPLNGIWATAPYLHNGSVPNLWELLRSPTAAPPEARRVARFYVGSTDIDTKHVGFVSDRGPFFFDTTLTSNSNAGHDYGTNLTETEKWQLIEYLKSL